MELILRDTMWFPYELWNGEKQHDKVELKIYCSCGVTAEIADKYYVETKVNGRIAYENFYQYSSAEYKKCVNDIVDKHKAYRNAIMIIRELQQ